MLPMALLISTDSWEKVQVYQAFLESHQPAVWRTKGRYTSEYISQIKMPLNLYFYHRNVVRYQAVCQCIHRGTGWPLEDVPQQFHVDQEPYRLFICLKSLRPIDDLPLHAFKRWDDPETCFERGQLGLLKAVDPVHG